MDDIRNYLVRDKPEDISKYLVQEPVPKDINEYLVQDDVKASASPRSNLYGPQPMPKGLENVLKHTGGAVMGALEKLDRPRSMLVSGIQAATGDRPASDIAEAAKGNIHPSFSEVLPDMNVPAPKWIDPDDDGKVNLKHVVGLGLDIVGDPLNLVGFGVATKGGKAARALSMIGKTYGDDAVRGILSKAPEAIDALKARGVSPKLLELASKADAPLAATLPEQAKAGQWAAASFAGINTPKKINVAASTGVDATRRALPRVPVVNKFINRTGDDVWDEGVRNLDYLHRQRTNEILDTGRATREAIDRLGDDAFGGKSSAAWHESEGGVWMENLLNGRFEARTLSPEQKKSYRSAAMMKGKDDEIVREGQRIVRGLMKKDFPEINGVKPYFSPGGKDKTFEEYVLHQLRGSAQDGVEKKVSSGRLTGLSFAEESLSNPDFVFRQKNGNRYWGTLYKTDKKDTLHVVVTEMEKDGRVREITQFPIKSKGSEIRNAIKKKFGDSTLEYVSDNVKNIGPSKLPAPKASSQYQQPGLASAGDDIISVNNANAPVKLAMSQRITRLNNAQREQMQQLGIPLESIDEAGYAYVPHTLTDEAKKEMRSSRFFTKGRLPTTKTPQALPRDYRWITDPETGEEFVGSVRAFAEERGIDPRTLQTRNATVDEINSVLGAQKFKTDLAEATTEAALRNERAISGAEQLEFFLRKAREDVLKAGPETPKHWRRPRLDVPERFISKDGRVHKVRNMLTELVDTPMPPEKARVIEARWKAVAKPEEAAKQLSDLYKAYESAWKRYTLFLFPEYHARNVIGDIWLGWMHGWKPSQIGKDMFDAAKIQAKSGAQRRIKTALYGDISGEDLIKTARDYGVIGTGQISEMEDIIAPINSAKGREVMRKVKEHAWDLKIPMKIAEALENNRRLALFLRKLKDGDTYEAAANSVARTLYDYGDLTDFEMNVMRRAFPFYTWMRKNIPAQAENLIRHPGKVSVMPKIKGAIEGAQEDAPPEETRPDWMRREFSIYTGRGDDGKSNFAMLGSYLPTSDLFRLGSSPEDALAGIASSLTPPVKVAAELATNRDFFRDRPIDALREEGKWSDLLWGNERTNYLGMNMPTTAQRLSELFPFTRALATADRLNPGGLFDAYAPTEEGQTRPYHDEMSGKQKVWKFFTGIKNYPVDLERESMYRLLDLRRDSSRAPGLNIDNARVLARRAYMEGDMESYDYYMSLIGSIVDKMEQEIGLWESYVQ